MKKVEHLGDAKAPDGTVLKLYRHDSAYTIRVNNVELMSTRRHNSEDKLAELVCEPLRSARAPRVLIGGLGLGFTLRAALSILPADATVVVAELIQQVITWNENPEYALAHAELQDPRVQLLHVDVAAVLKQPDAGFDAIMMDVDNGAESFTTRGNSRLYQNGGIHIAAGALRARGLIAYWSANEDNVLVHAMREAGLAVEKHSARAHVTSGAWHTIYVGVLKA
ncbi:MAG: spermidine synthase [Gemmatimonadaceae bacterium]